MPRSKAVTIVLNTLAEVQEAVRRLAAALRRRTEVAAEKDEKIAAVRETYSGALAGLDKQVKDGRPPIERWALRNLDLFAGKRSLELTHGTIGFRLHPPAVAVEDTAAAIAELEKWPKAFRERFLRTTVELKLADIRDAILAGGPDAEMLKTLGLAVVQDEQFFIEPKADGPDAPAA